MGLSAVDPHPREACCASLAGPPHKWGGQDKKKGSPELGLPLTYFAYSIALVSRTTVTRIWPGKLSSVSIRLAMSRAMS